MHPCITFSHQEIKVGPNHQAVVPDHPSFPPYARGKPQDDLLWSPRHTTEERGRGGRWRKGVRGRMLEEGRSCGERREGGKGREEGKVEKSIPKWMLLAYLPT